MAGKRSCNLTPEPTAKQRAILLGMSPSERIALRLCILAEPGDTAAERTASGLCLRWMDAMEADEIEISMGPASAQAAADVISRARLAGRPTGG